VSTFPPLVDVDRLENGLALQAVEMHALPIVSVGLMLRAGSIDDPAGRAGLGHLTGSSLDAGTLSSDIHTLAERIEFLGTSLHVAVVHDATSIVCTTLTHHLDDAMSVVGDILCNAAFPQQEVDRLRASQTTSLLQMHDRPGTRASQALDAVLFSRRHPYGRPVMGEPEDVEQLARPDTRAFFQNRYRPGGAVAIAAGDTSISVWRDTCERHLGKWLGIAPASQAIPFIPDVERRKIFLIDRPATPQAEVRVGCIAMPGNHPDYLAATLLNYCLGGQFTSRLNLSLRERRGLTYGAWSAFSPFRLSGAFVEGGAFHTERTAEAIRVMIDEMERIVQDGISQEELRFAQQSMRGNFLRSFETPSQVGGRLQAIFAYDLPGDYHRTYLDRLAALTLEGIHRVAQHWLIPDRMAIVVVGDRSGLKDQLRKAEFGDIVDYSDF